MRHFTRFFKRPILGIAPPIPPLVLRTSWDNYAHRIRDAISAEMEIETGRITLEEAQARLLTRELGTPSAPTLQDMNRTHVWHMHDATTARIAAQEA